MVIKIISEPKTRDANRQPKEFIPKICSPAAISHLPTSGWTMNEAESSITSTLPAVIDALADSGQLRS
jgi:hypothetical protein